MKDLKDETKCGSFKENLTTCASPAFKKANTTIGYKY